MSSKPIDYASGKFIKVGIHQRMHAQFAGIVQTGNEYKYLVLISEKNTPHYCDEFGFCIIEGKRKHLFAAQPPEPAPLALAEVVNIAPAPAIDLAPALESLAKLETTALMLIETFEKIGQVIGRWVDLCEESKLKEVKS